MALAGSPLGCPRRNQIDVGLYFDGETIRAMKIGSWIVSSKEQHAESSSKSLAAPSLMSDREVLSISSNRG